MWDGPALLKPGLLKLHVVGSKPSNEKSKHQLSTVACKPQRKSTQNRSEIDQKSTPNRLQNGPRSAQGAIGGPKGAPERPRAPPEASKVAPREAQKAPLDPTGAPKERSGNPKERPRRVKEAPEGGVGGAKSSPRHSRSQKKSISTKVLRDPPLPIRQTLRTSPNRSKIGPKSIQDAPSDPSSDLLGRHRPLGGASGGLSERLGAPRAASGAPRGRPGSTRAPQACALLS